MRATSAGMGRASCDVMNRAIFATFVVSSLLVAACSHMSPVKGPDGQEWVAISCSHDVKNCWKAAGDFCPLGYVTADEVQSTRHGLLPFSRRETDEILIHCKAPSVQSAALESRPGAEPRKE